MKVFAHRKRLDDCACGQQEVLLVYKPQGNVEFYQLDYPIVILEVRVCDKLEPVESHENLLANLTDMFRIIDTTIERFSSRLLALESASSRKSKKNCPRKT